MTPERAIKKIRKEAARKAAKRNRVMLVKQHNDEYLVTCGQMAVEHGPFKYSDAISEKIELTCTPYGECAHPIKTPSLGELFYHANINTQIGHDTTGDTRG